MQLSACLIGCNVGVDMGIYKNISVQESKRLRVPSPNRSSEALASANDLRLSGDDFEKNLSAYATIFSSIEMGITSVRGRGRFCSSISFAEIPAPVCLSQTRACFSSPSFLNISAPKSECIMYGLSPVQNILGALVRYIPMS